MSQMTRIQWIGSASNDGANEVHEQARIIQRVLQVASHPALVCLLRSKQREHLVPFHAKAERQDPDVSDDFHRTAVKLTTGMSGAGPMLPGIQTERATGIRSMPLVSRSR